MQRLLRHVAGCVDDIVRDRMGWSLPPPKHALRMLDFTCDDPEMYCRWCGESVGQGEVTERGCARCRIHRPVVTRFVRLGPYANPLKQLIQLSKYRPWPEMAIELGSLLGERVERVAAPGNPLLVPMPMPFVRRLYRGIDHTHHIALGVQKSMRRAGLSAPIMSLLRKANGPPQVTLPHGERLHSPGRRMSLRRRAHSLILDEFDVVVIDDVRTTSATLRAAARLLRPLQPRTLTAAIIAVSDDSRRTAGERVAHRPKMKQHEH